MQFTMIGKLILFFCACYSVEASFNSKRKTCGGSLSGLNGAISSPNYPQNYPNDAICQWIIQGPREATRIEITFNDFDVEWGSSCEWDSLIIKDKGGKQIGKPLCGRLDKPKIIIPGDTAIVIFKSDDAANEKGFIGNFVTIVPAKPFPFGSCNFDEGLCPGLSNIENSKDDFDWTINGGETPTALTGPKNDHSGQGKYIYIESTGRSEGDKALLETEVLSSTNKCLGFFYYMYGIVGMGSFKVYVETKATKSLVMSLTGNQGNEWKKAQIQVNELLPYKVVFEGVVGKSEYSDIAIDDISFSTSACTGKKGCGGVLIESSGSFSSPSFPDKYPDNSRCQWTIQPQDKTAVIVITFHTFDVETEAACRDDYVTILDPQDQPVKQQRFCGFYGDGFGLKVFGNKAKVYFHSNGHLARKGFRASYKILPLTSAGDCDFDTGMCAFWTNAANDDFDWSLGKVATPSFFTGPAHDLYGLGNYAFTEASHRRLGDKAILVSGPIRGPQCLSFSYSMDGRRMGSLIVSVKNNKGSLMTVWATSGDHGKYWLTENINIDVGEQAYQVMFEGVVGDSFTGDIGIDEISFKSGRCTAEPACEHLFTSASGSFHSPHFPSPYPSGVDCTWIIIPPAQYKDVVVIFHSVDLEQSPQCSKDYIIVEDMTGTPKGDKICGTKTNQSVEVDWHQARVHFHSDNDLTAEGFDASYRALGSLPVCGGELSGRTGTFTSPSYPANYPKRITCDWEITTAPGSQEISIEFQDFAIDDSPVSCAYDFLLVFDAQHGQEVGKYCGMTKPLPIKIPGNAANIRFQSSYLSSARGFKARFRAL